MVWKMMIEEFQDGAFVLGNLRYANGVILAIGARSLPSSFCSRGNMVWKMLFEEIQDGCLVLGNLRWSNWMI